MGVSPVRFSGQDLYAPGYYSKRNIDKLSVGSASGSRLLILGECKGGVPNNASTDFPNADDRINWISDTGALKSQIVDGPAYDAALFALSPSNEDGVNGAPAVGIVRVNKAVKATSTIIDTESSNLRDLSSRIYGLRANQIQYKITAGTTAGRKISIKFEDQTIEKDDLYLAELSLIYSGIGSACSLTLDPAGNFVTTPTAGAAGDGITIAMATYNTISSLIAYLNAYRNKSGSTLAWARVTTTATITQTGHTLSNGDKITINVTSDAAAIPTGTYTVANVTGSTFDITCLNAGAASGTCSYGGDAIYTAVMLGDGNFLTTNLDKIIAGDSINLITTAKTIYANLYSFDDYIANGQELLQGAVSTSAVRRMPKVMSSYIFLSGGTEGAAVVQQDWQDALDMCKLIDASFVLAATSDSAVGAALSAHIKYMNGVTGRNERQGGYGSGTADAKAIKIAAAQAINNSAMGYAGTELKRYNELGAIETYPGYCLMAAVIGMSSGNDINFSPTNKMLNTLGVKEKYSTTDIDDYIKAGVIIAQPSEQGGIRTIRAITTYQGSNIIANEWSAMREILYVTKDHRVYVQSMIGKPGESTTLESVKNRAELRLKYYEDGKIFVIDPAYGNSYRNFTFSVLGDVITISYEATIVLPINFILVNHNFTVIGFKG